MRFREFTLVTEATDNNVYVVGDSIAVGIKNAGNFPGIAVGGKNASQVLDMVNTLVNQYPLKGSTVILSSGASNSTFERKNGQRQNLNPAPIAAQIRALKQAGARVVLVGTGSQQSKWITNSYGEYRVNFADQDVNDKLAEIAADNGAGFLGPLENYDAGLNTTGDGIHPGGGGYQKMISAALGSRPQNQKTKPDSSSGADSKPQKEKTKTNSPTQLSVPMGRSGPEIANIQKTLLALGYALPQHGVDGIRGPETIAAVKQFQQDNGLQVDGDPGPETVAKLNQILVAGPESYKAAKKAKNVEKPNQLSAATPVAYDAVTKGRIGEILNFVAGPESRGYYDMMFGGTRDPRILKMTIKDLVPYQLAHANRAGSSAAGRYQIMHFNTVNYAQKAGLDPDTDRFTPENQDKMAIEFLKERGLDRWLAGTVSDAQFLEGLAQIWAGLPAPSKGGQSYYGGVGLNRYDTSVDMKTALNTLSDIKTA